MGRHYPARAEHHFPAAEMAGRQAVLDAHDVFNVPYTNTQKESKSLTSGAHHHDTMC